MQSQSDVTIIGGGLASTLLARQLRRRCPDLHVRVIEKQTSTTYKVGESTVEIAAFYLLRELGLSRYLYDQQLPKNGLRFFFDTPEKHAELTQMSELGSDALPRLPAFQLDRARFEADVRAMNIAQGVEYLVGWKVESVQPCVDSTISASEQRSSIEVSDPQATRHRLSALRAAFVLWWSGPAWGVGPPRRDATSVRPPP